MMPTPPTYRFALFGLRRSGKTVFLAALNADRRPISDGSTISYEATDPPEIPGQTVAERDARMRRAKERLLENARGLNLGRVPAETETAEGVTTHRFVLTLPKPHAPGASGIIRLELVDYAGELLKPVTDEAAMQARLHQILAETDGLVILAEAPPPMGEHQAEMMAVQPLSELATALNSLHEADPTALRCAALLVTKWDRHLPFDLTRNHDEPMSDFQSRAAAEEARHRHRFTDWLADGPEAGRLWQLNEKLRASFKAEDYSIWPASAFGVAKVIESTADDGLPIEVSANTELNALNLVEPLQFLIDRTRAQHRAKLEKLTPVDRIEPADLPSDDEILSEHGADEALLAHARALRDAALAKRAERRGRRIRQWVWGSVAACATVALVIGGVSWRVQAAHIAELRKTIGTALEGDDLSRVIAAKDQVIGTLDERPWLGPVFSDEDRRSAKAALSSRECELWGLRVGQGMLDAELARTRQEILPQCAGLDLALAKEAERLWRLDVQAAQDALDEITANGSCGMLAFDRSDMDRATQALLAHLSHAPEVLRDQAQVWQDEASKARQDCLAQSDLAYQNDVQEKSNKDLQGKLDGARRKLEREDWQDYLGALKKILSDTGPDQDDWTDRSQRVREALTNMKGALRRWRPDTRKTDDHLREMEDVLREIDGFKGMYPALAVDLDPLRESVVETQDRLKAAAVCATAQGIVDQYTKMQNDLAARHPKAMDELLAALESAKQEEALKPLVQEVQPVLNGQAVIARITAIEVQGNVPLEYRKNAAVSGKLHIVGAMFDLPEGDANKNSGFRLINSIKKEARLNAPIGFRLILEQHNWGKNRHFEGHINVDTGAMFNLMSGSGTSLTPTANLSIPIALDSDGVSAEPSSGTTVQVRLNLSASALPNLLEVPKCPAD